MEIELERRADCQLIRVSGDLRFWNHSDQEEKLLAAFGTVLDNDPREVVLNLLGVKMIDSRGIATVVRLPVRCAQRNIQLKVVMPRGVPREAIKHIHLFDPWPTFEEESAALAPAGQSTSAPLR